VWFAKEYGGCTSFRVMLWELKFAKLDILVKSAHEHQSRRCKAHVEILIKTPAVGIKDL